MGDEGGGRGIRESAAASTEAEPRDPPAEADPLDVLADGLLHAYGLARADEDPVVIGLVEQALVHVGRRIARRVGPVDAGIACH